MRNYTKYICLFLMVLGISFSQKAWGTVIDKTGYSISIDAIDFGTWYTSEFVEGGIDKSYTVTVTLKAGYTGAIYAYLSAGDDFYLDGGDLGAGGFLGSAAGTYTFEAHTLFTEAGSFADVLYINFANPSATEEIDLSGIVISGSRPSHTISFSVGYGSAPSSLTGSTITLPTIPAVCSAASEAGWIPYGWATASVANNSSSATIVGAPGDTYYPDANRTLYAVYLQPGTTLSSSTSFTQQASGGKDVSPSDRYMPTDGYVLITQVNSGSTAISNTISGNYINVVADATKPTLSSTTMTNSDATCVWEVDMPTDGEFTFRNLATKQYLALNSSGNGALIGSVTDYAIWTVGRTSKEGFFLTNKGKSGYYLNYTSGYGWKGASSYNGTTDNIYFWRAVSATTTSKYQSALPMCGFQVTYNGNGKTSGSVPEDNTVYTSGATVTVKSNSGSLAKTGYTFSGWNTSPDGNGTDRAASSTFSITTDVTLYAKWVAKEYTVNLNKDGGSGGSTSVTATYDAAMPSAGSAPTFSGYDFGGYYAEVGGGGTQYYNSTPASAHLWDVDANPSTIYAKWTQEVTLDKNGGAADKSVTVTYHGAGTSSFTAVTRDGYDCTGYWDATSGGNKVITDAGALVSYSAAVGDYINSSGKWCHSGATTLYAQWSAKTYTVTLNQGDGTGGSTGVTATYGSDMPSATMPTAPTGYTFAGYYYGETIYYNADGSSARAWDIAEETTLIARYTINTPTLTVASVDDVTITATPSGGDAIGETGSATVNYNTSVELTYTSLTSNYYFEGWDVYETGNSGNKVTVSNNSFTMPNYHVTVSAIVRPNTQMKAWCPVITLTKTDGDESPILITSVSGQAIKAVRTLHLTVTGAPTPSSVVTLSGDNLKFYADFSGTVKEITSSNKLTCTSYALDKTIYVAYAPTGTYSSDNWNSLTITSACLNSDESEAASIEVEDLVHVRRLPDNGTSGGQGFVIAAKVGANWVALPSSIIAGAQDGLPITVNDDENPTSVTLAPSSARFNLYNVYTSVGSNDRHKQYGDYAYLAGKNSKALKAAPSGANISLGVNVSTYTGGSEDAAYFEWLLSTTDKKNYTLTNNGRTAQLKYYTTHDKFGMYTYATQVITEFRLLPATFYENASAQILEWKENSVVVMYTGSETTATTKVGNNEESDPQTLANNKLTHGIYEFTTDQALTSNDGAALEISFGDGSTRTIVEIPIIITGNTTATSGHAGQDVVIRNGGKLTAASTQYDYYNVYVYGGGALSIPEGATLGVNNIILRAGGLITSGIGSTPAVSYDNSYPQVGIIGTVVSTVENIQYEYVTDYFNWYHFCLPFDATLSTIHYPLEYYGDNVREDNTGSWVIKRYAGEIRATGEYDAWKDIETEGSTSVTAGHGYLYWGAPKKLTIGGLTDRSAWGIQRITMPVTASDAKTAENANKVVSGLGSWSDVDNASKKDNDKGWNLIGNPYLVNLIGLTGTSIRAGELVKELDDNEKWTGKWIWDEETESEGLRYVTIPSDHFETYTAYPVSWFTSENPMVNGRAFFVQLAEGQNAVTFEVAKRKPLMPALFATAKVIDVETGIVMSDETHKDEVNFWIKEGKTAEYEFNADYPKTPNATNFNIYGVHSQGDLSWVAVGPEIAESPMAIGYQVPEAGEYMLSLSETYTTDEIDHFFVTDHETSPEITTDLMVQDYVFNVQQAETNNTRFTVAIILKKDAPIDPTSLNNIDTDSDQPQKFIYQDKMYILYHGFIYDATGKRVRGINK